MDRRRIRFRGGIAERALAHYEQKYGQNPTLLQKLQKHPKSKAAIQSEQDEELEDLFESVVEEIEERQRHLEDMGDQATQDIQTRMKNEIVDRIGELQRIRDLQARQL